MELCRQLFKIAASVEGIRDSALPYPREFVGCCPAVGTCRFSTRIAYGAGRQFEHRRRDLSEKIISLLCGSQDRATLRAHQGLLDVLGEFFGHAPNQPALLWISPVWTTTANWAAGAGLKRHDATLSISDQTLASAGASWRRLTFSSLNHVIVPVRELAFFYPNAKVRTLLHVPRRRYLEDSAGTVWRGYEEGLGLGNLREQKALQRGVYTPSRLHYRVVESKGYLDQMTVTFARMSPFPSSAASRRPPLAFTGGFSRFAGSSDQNSERMFAIWTGARFSCKAILGDRRRDALCAFKADSREAWPESARVEFLRLTFDPATMKIVVFLAAERDFDRFLAEHAGITELLDGALARPGNGA